MIAEIIAKLALEREMEIRRQVARMRRADPAVETPRHTGAESLRRWRSIVTKFLERKESKGPVAEPGGCLNTHASEC